MSLFTKLGTSVKKGLKQVSLKNVVKLGTPFLSAIPLVGGVLQTGVESISQASAAKKEANAARKAGNEQQAQLLEERSAMLSANAGKIAGVAAGSVAGTFTKAAITEAKNLTSVGTREGVGSIGATMVDSTINAWFKLHLKKILAIVGLLGVFFAWKKFGGKKPVSKTRRY